ncbi:UNVERIFIED_CONTAM: hypothetical protein FKN15_009686 [Acipenser sinensis]
MFHWRATGSARVLLSVTCLAPEAAGPSAPSKIAPGEKAAEWTVVARRKKKAAARSTGAAEQGAMKPAAAPSGGGSGGVPGKGTPSTAPPARQGGKAARKTKHLLPTEGEEKSAARGELPVNVTGQGTASGSIRGRQSPAARKCTRLGLLVGVPGGAIEGPQKQKRPPRRPPSTGTATEGGKDPSPEAVQGSAEAAEPMEEAPVERPKGREEPARAEIALRVDPLPVSKETSEAGPDSTIEGPAAAGVAEGAQEGPPKKQLPRAPPSSEGDTGPDTCVAEEGVIAEPAPEAGVGSTDNAEPRQATPAEGPEGGKEIPQEQEPPRAPEASVGSADNAEPMQVAPAGGSEGGEEPPHQEQKLPQASLSCGDGGFGPRDAAEGDKETPPEADEETPPEAEAGSAEPALTLVSGARKGGEEPERAEGGALERPPRRPPSTGTATEGEKDPSPEAVRGSAEEAAEPLEEAPAERPKGREEPARAERALRVDPLPVPKEPSEAGPDST